MQTPVRKPSVSSPSGAAAVNKGIMRCIGGISSLYSEPLLRHKAKGGLFVRGVGGSGLQKLGFSFSQGKGSLKIALCP